MCVCVCGCVGGCLGLHYLYLTYLHAWCKSDCVTVDTSPSVIYVCLCVCINSIYSVNLSLVAGRCNCWQINSVSHTHTHTNQRGFTVCSLKPNCSLGPCESVLKPLAAAILRLFSVCCWRVCVFVCFVSFENERAFHFCLLKSVRLCYLLPVAVQAPVTSAFFPADLASRQAGRANWN